MCVVKWETEWNGKSYDKQNLLTVICVLLMMLTWRWIWTEKNQSTLSTGKFNFLLRLWHASWIPYKDKKLIEDFSDFSTKLANSTHVENNFTHCEFHNPLKFEYIIKIFNEKRTQQKKEEPPKWRWWWAREREMNHKKCQHTKKCLCWRARSWERTKTEW